VEELCLLVGTAQSSERRSGALIPVWFSRESFYTGISTDWFRAVLGGMLLAAVLLNNYLRYQALRSR
jgi:hypothetical protein